jgi:CheY-like chemotaxis protein
MPIAILTGKIKNTLIGILKGTVDVVSSTIGVTRELTANTLHGISGKRSDTSRVVKQAVTGAMQAGYESGTELGSVAKGAIIGAVQGVDEVRKVTLGVFDAAVGSAVKVTGDIGGDIATVARKAMEGAIDVGKQVGLKAEDVASASASAAIEAAQEFGDKAIVAVTKAVSGTISGIKVEGETLSQKPLILAVDSNQSDLELLIQDLVREGYDTIGAASLQQFDESLDTRNNIALALIDLSGFDQNIWERCEVLRMQKIPFIVISPQRSPAIQRDSTKYDASGLLVKPVGTSELMEHIHTLLGD